MDFKILSLLLVLSISYISAETLYQHYTGGGIKSGLKINGPNFELNGKELRIFSGSFHYFRVVPQYWKSVLQKFRAAGLNAVQFYSPWNLHEETPGNFDFESYLINLRDFLKEIKAQDMFAIARPGPFICGEWEFGGFPAWLLRDTNMHLRSNYKPYLEAVERYFAKIVPILHEFEFTNGGPVIALQIENEYGGIKNNNDYEYLSFLQQSVLKHGYKDLIFMSENGGRYGTFKNLPDVLHTANWMGGSLKVLEDMKKVQGNKPLFMTEYWSGWMDSWGGKTHNTRWTRKEFEAEMNDVLFRANASINFYMFIGGTNFGFMSGGSVTTSYDYMAPLSEAGDITAKWTIAKNVIDKFNKEKKITITIPAAPGNTPKARYGVVKPHDYLSLEDILNKVKSVTSDRPKAMELLDLGTNHGQHFGFTLYRTTIQKSNHIKLQGGVSDRGSVLIDHKEIAVVSQDKDWEMDINANVFNANKDHTLDILVENTGRECGTDRNKNLKGLKGNVYLNKETKEHTGFKIYPLEFKSNFVNSLKAEKGRALEKISGPGLFRAELDIQGAPKDTFMKLDNWQKGNVFVNGFNIGRYWHVGPQHTLYIPAPLLKTGKNDIFIFELHSAGNQVEFVDSPSFAPLDHQGYL